MRTLAEALTAIQTRIIGPAREPKQADLIPAVAAGVSRELVIAVSQVLRNPAVALLEASFQWASSATAPAAIPGYVQLPSEANPLLVTAARLLQQSRREPHEQITGPIIEVRHIVSDPSGSVSIQTVRHGRPAEVRVLLSAKQLDPTYEWMRSARTIMVEGQIIHEPGKPLRIDSPSGIYPLDETYLPHGES